MAKAKDDAPLVELQALFPIGGRLTVKEPFSPDDPDRERADCPLRVRALTAREIVTALAEITAIIATLETGKKWIDIARDHFEDACGVVAQATGSDAAWIADLDGGDFLRLWKAFLGANQSFFTEAADLFLGATRQKMSRLLNGAGLTSSPSSPPAGSSTQ